MSATRVRPELLAPAGSMETLWAAYEAGADAFYLAGKDFNARKRASNFSFEELEMAAQFAHARNRKIYCTMNTLVFDREIPRAIELLQWLQRIRIDAVIVHDLGVLYLLRKYFSSIPIHASTQLFCHNSLQARFLKENGVSRIILSRELRIGEIAAIRKRVKVEIEVFVHGAMCFSFSGCCGLSGATFGKSGNRGECRQVCRFPFQADDKRQFPFSMKDLSTKEIFGKILEAKPAAIKIEGRMKNAAYVRETVSLYRSLIDNQGQKPEESSPPHAPLGRPACVGHFLGHGYADLVNPGESGNIGRLVGKVLSASVNGVRVQCRGRLQKGSQLRVQAGNGQNLLDGVLLDFSRLPSGKGETVLWRPRVTGSIDWGKLAGASVYQTGRSLAAKGAKRIAEGAREFERGEVKLQLQLRKGILRVGATDIESGFELDRQYPVTDRMAKKPGATSEAAGNIFMETGDLPFAVRQVKNSIPISRFVPLSEIKATRRTFYSEFDAILREGFEKREEETASAILAELKSIQGSSLFSAEETAQSKPQSKKGPRQVNPGVRQIGLNENLPSLADSQEILLLPLFVSESRVGQWCRKLKGLVANGFKRFMVPTYGWLPVFNNLPDAWVCGGPSLHATNSFARHFLESLGVEAFVVSPEWNGRDLEKLNGFDRTLRVGKLPFYVLASRISIPGRRYTVGGQVFHVRQFEEYSVLEKLPTFHDRSKAE